MFIGQYVFIHSNPEVHIYKNNVAPGKYFAVAAISLCSTTKQTQHPALIICITKHTLQNLYLSAVLQITLLKTWHISAVLKKTLQNLPQIL